VIAASEKLMGIATRTAYQKTLPGMVWGSSGSNTTLESLQELPYKRHCTECCGEGQDCSIRKACRDCKQNCGTKDIALKVRTLRVDCSIRKLTGTARRIALQMTLSQ
jgi:hypothetical protein